MSATKDQQNFSWSRVRELFGLPYRDSRVQDLFADLRLDPDALWRELRVGIYSMPPYDQQPSPIAEIDLIPSYHVRLRFKHARLLVSAKTESPKVFVMAAVTYFLESQKPKDRFAGDLPFGIGAADSLEKIAQRAGAPPTTQDLGDEDGYVLWEDRDPRLHVLFSTRENRPLRVNVFLAEKEED